MGNGESVESSSGALAISPRLTALDRSWLTAIGLCAAVITACWAAASNAIDRWFAPWGSETSAFVFLGAIALWGAAVHQGTRLTPSGLRPSTRWLATSAGILFLYATLYPRVPQLVSCELAAAALACAALGVLPAEVRRHCWGIGALLLLSMHVATSVEFFVGYPLRFVSTWLAAIMLGPVAQSHGTGLTDGVNLYYVDAPCSGIHMLTSSLVMAAGAAVLLRLHRGKTVALLFVAAGLAVFGNAHRAATLFVVGAADDEFHEIIGVIVFAECQLLLILAAYYLMRRQRRLVSPNTAASADRPAGSRLTAIFAAACVAAAFSPFLALSNPAPNSTAADTVNWPSTWEGTELIPQPLSAEVAAYLQDFPGQWAQFRLAATDTIVLLRLCTMPTRKLHSAENCYLAMGGACHPEPSVEDDDGHVWSRFEYRSPQMSRTYVRQCYFSILNPPQGDALEDWLDDAQSWPDISAWYWAASLPGSDVKLTLAVIVASSSY